MYWLAKRENEKEAAEKPEEKDNFYEGQGEFGFHK